MKEVKKGDKVTRNSHNNDIVFFVDKIINLSNNEKICILKGIDIRVEADANINDLKVLSKDEEKRCEKNIKEKIKRCIEREVRDKKIIKTGKILHLDGDKKYSEKSIEYYKKMKLDAVVKNVPENRQPKVVYRLLKMYNPNILVITRTWWDD